jgi:hypothetical protein
MRVMRTNFALALAKRALALLIAAALAGSASARVAPGMEDNIDRPGSDIYRFVLSSGGPGACQQECTAHVRCKAWTYVRPGVQGGDGVCYLKDSVPAPASSTCCISGVKAVSEREESTSLPEEIGPQMENNFDRPGSDFARFEANSPGYCQRACHNDNDCRAWTYVRAGFQGPRPVCYLKRSQPRPVPNNCCISGTPPGGEY